MGINYTKAPRTTTTVRATVVDDAEFRANLTAFIAGGSTNPNRPVHLTGGQSVNLDRLAGHRNT